jgi:hypothetical protein
MTWIVNRCPFYEKETQVVVPHGTIVVRPYQMVPWVSLRVRETVSRPFPAVVDTGHSHNFSIRTTPTASPLRRESLRLRGLRRSQASAG